MAERVQLCDDSLERRLAVGAGEAEKDFVLQRAAQRAGLGSVRSLHIERFKRRHGEFVEAPPLVRAPSLTSHSLSLPSF